MSFSCLRASHPPVNSSPLKSVLFYHSFLLMSSFSPNEAVALHLDPMSSSFTSMYLSFIYILYTTYIYLPLVSKGTKRGHLRFKNSATVLKKTPGLCHSFQHAEDQFSLNRISGTWRTWTGQMKWNCFISNNPDIVQNTLRVFHSALIYCS